MLLPEVQDQTLVMEIEKNMLSCFWGLSNSHFGSIHLLVDMMIVLTRELAKEIESDPNQPWTCTSLISWYAWYYKSTIFFLSFNFLVTCKKIRYTIMQVLRFQVRFERKFSCSRSNSYIILCTFHFHDWMVWNKIIGGSKENKS